MKFAFYKRCSALVLVLIGLFLMSGCKEKGSTAPVVETTVPTVMITETTFPAETTGETEYVEETTQPEVSEPAVRIPWYETSRLIYHAAGEIGGFTYTNSREAVENSLSLGNMLLEIDFLFTSDGHLVCLHEWPNLMGLGGPVPLERFLSLKIFNKFATITAEDVIEYMRQYPDMYLITDTKEADSCAVIGELLRLCDYDPDIADRFVIQLYDGGVREQMQELYPFQDENFLFTTYKFGPQRISDIMELCEAENIQVITAPYGSWDKATIQKLQDAGFIIFEHTLKYTSMVKNALSRGVYGFYTDALQPSDLELNKLRNS